MPEAKDITIPKYLNSREFAAMLGVGPQFPNKLRHANRGPRYLKVGGVVRYRLCDIEEWLAKRERNGADGDGSDDE